MLHAVWALSQQPIRTYDFIPEGIGVENVSPEHGMVMTREGKHGRNFLEFTVVFGNLWNFGKYSAG